MTEIGLNETVVLNMITAVPVFKKLEPTFKTANITYKSESVPETGLVRISITCTGIKDLSLIYSLL